MSPSYLPVTVDGREIDIGAPRSRGMTDAQAQTLVDRAETYRQAVPHFHFDLTGRDLTVFAANFPDGPVIFNFGDRSGELTEQSSAAQATATHTYAADGTYVVSVRNEKQRWSMDVPVNWPEPPVTVPPVIESLSPDEGTVPNNEQMHVLGSGFTPQSVIVWVGQDEPTTFHNSGDISTGVKLDLENYLARPGLYPVKVRNADGALSDALNFEIKWPPDPTLTGLDPASTAADAAFTLAAVGTNFLPRSVIVFDGDKQPTTYVSAERLTCEMPALPAGMHGVLVNTIDEHETANRAFEIT